LPGGLQRISDAVRAGLASPGYMKQKLISEIRDRNGKRPDELYL
jgi:hypothetical protein